MEPTEEGYLLKAANSANFVYPRRGLFSRLKEMQQKLLLVDVLPPVLNPNDFEMGTNAIIKNKYRRNFRRFNVEFGGL